MVDCRFPPSSVFPSKIRNPQSRILYALAFAPNQDARHGLGGTTRLGECSVGTVPAGVVGIVSRGPSPAAVALAARGSLIDGLMGSGRPVFVNVGLDYFGRRS